ncbi:hypothetical protein ACFQGR_06815 [Weissella sagaensis]|uniref:DUF4230 domain-containing protein n=1 Tax=Weissella sagaensis TaxID=2559928 RepID=A0ABW1RUH8_9LACO|nr:hypothetical protein [Weissella sagaensis]MBU7567329.1 hypothetical protein [Weissella hellenica]QDJ59367.1 hypothetical protein EFA59_07545 [Weissella hellenica]UEG67490.1 hypothetical protein GZH44_02990 [Weissella hellenica]
MIKRHIRKPVRFGFVLGIIISLLVGAGIALASYKISHQNNKSNLTPKTQTVSQDTLTVKSLTKEKKIVMVNLGLSEILNEKRTTKLFGQDIVGTNRQKIMQASFDAELGIDGKDVKITATGDNTYKITVKKFIFIGYSNPNFKVLDEHNGVFSSFTADVSETEMINKVLDTKSKQKYVAKYNDLLEQSTTDFYRNIVTATNPKAKLTFIFPEK